MQTTRLVLLLLAVVAVVAAAPTPDSDDDDYEYDNYDYGSDEDDDDDYRLPSSMFDDLQPHHVQQSSPQPSACSWAVVQCCGVPDRMGHRASCFQHLGCPGSWFSDICASTVQRSIFKSVFGSFRGR